MNNDQQISTNVNKYKQMSININKYQQISAILTNIIKFQQISTEQRSTHISKYENLNNKSVQLNPKFPSATLQSKETHLAYRNFVLELKHCIHYLKKTISTTEWQNRLDTWIERVSELRRKEEFLQK